MAKLPAPAQKTAAAIFARHERDSGDWRRDHLGASLIGRECGRELWYKFRWASAPTFPGRVLRLFERGQREETWLVDELRAIGVELHTEDPEHGDGRQILAEIFPHFGGSMDGIGRGFPEAPKTWHVWECKTANDKQFKRLQRDGVRKAKPEHYAQMQVYMLGKKLKRAFYMCVNKNDDTIYCERVYYDKRAAEALVAKARMIVDAPEPLERISNDPAWYACKFCDHRPVCHLGEVEQLVRSCRTCVSSTPMADGTWSCALFGSTQSSDAQRDDCSSHLFIPALLPWEVISVDDPGRRVTYRRGDGAEVVDVGDDLVVKP